jgi:membrane associated rhomboid family serine protease
MPRMRTVPPIIVEGLLVAVVASATSGALNLLFGVSIATGLVVGLVVGVMVVLLWYRPRRAKRRQ